VYHDEQEFRATITSLRPLRIEIGAIRISPPIAGCPLSERLSREFCIDIDIDAYDGKDAKNAIPARSCCCTNNEGCIFCPLCWPLVTLGARQLDKVLQILGSDKHVWFYSGRRGMHCWNFSDDVIFHDPSEQIRRALASYLCMSGKEVAARASGPDPDVPCLERLKILLGPKGKHNFQSWYFVRFPFLAMQALKSCAERVCMSAMPGPERDGVMRLVFNNDQMRLAKEAESMRLKKTLFEEHYYPLDDIRKHVSNTVMSMFDETCIDWSRSAIAVVAEASVMCLGPRIDLAVSIDSGHLLRAPMGINNATMRQSAFVAEAGDSTALEAFYPCDECVPRLVLTDEGNVDLQPVETAHKVRHAFDSWIKRLLKIRSSSSESSNS
jgi:hypothetical protein